MRLIDLIRTHHSTETTTSLTSDRFITGYLNLLDVLYTKFPSYIELEDCSNYIFYNCLFNKENGEVKCKLSDSRTAAYKVMNSIIKYRFNRKIYDDLTDLIS